MATIKTFWRGLGARSRAGLVGGALLIGAAMSAFAYWTLHTDYGVLFSGLAEADLSTVSAELDKMKVPHKVGDDGHSVLVPEEAVHKTRVALMGREMPLRGAVGFELFNNMEFGVSEFVQKVNFQRALQGELTRTILSIDELQSARVHLVLAEQSLFKKDSAKSKASVTVAVKPGRTLQPAQVQGIQRLVAASVPDVLAQDVTVLDQHGVALSRSVQADGAMLDTGNAQLDLKRGMEAYLAQKAARVLDNMFGAGASVVSVDAVFSQEQTRVTTEEVLAARGSEPGQPAGGVVLRERQTVKEGAPDASGQGSTGTTVTNTETDYQAGKRTEQVVSPAGALKHLNVAVVVKPPLSDAELERVRQLVAASVGLNTGRGDVVSVHSMQQMHTGNPPAAVAKVAPRETAVKAAPSPQPSSSDQHTVLAAIVGLLVLTAVAGLGLARGARRRHHAQALLDETQRARVLHSMQQWLEHQPADRAQVTR